MADLLADWTVRLALSFVALTGGAAVVLAVWARLSGRSRQARIDEEWARRRREGLSR